MKHNTPLIELIDYTLTPEGAGSGLFDFSFALFPGDCYSIETDSINDAVLLLKALVTWVSPQKGIYCFNGLSIDLSDYRNALPCKRQVGYIASEAAVISNRTIRENLLFMRYYHEDSLELNLDEHTADLCRKFDIFDKLDRHPGELHHRDIQNTITVRELTKCPSALILERPEDFVDQSKIRLFKEILTDMIQRHIPVVFYSADPNFIKSFSNKKISLSRGRSMPLSLTV